MHGIDDLDELLGRTTTLTRQVLLVLKHLMMVVQTKEIQQAGCQALAQARVLSQLGTLPGALSLLQQPEIIGHIIKFTESGEKLEKAMRTAVIGYGVKRATLGQTKMQFFNNVGITTRDERMLAISLDDKKPNETKLEK